MTFNIEDLRTTDLLRDDHPRLKAAALMIQELRPDILLVNEISYDMPGVPGFSPNDGEGANARRFVENYLAVSQGEGLDAIDYVAFAPPTNTGLHSGFDLNNDGVVVTEFPVPEPAGPDGRPPRQTQEQRAYGNDCWGFGTFPGQYGMALFVAPELTILTEQVRSFQFFRWNTMPGALKPVYPDSAATWYSEAEWEAMRLSSKNHVDVPILLPGGSTLHVLISHPTPPAFDGPERRNKLRNHDEIRFWVDYVDGRSYFLDDDGRAGGLGGSSSFVIMGDLNADPDEGSSYGDPAASLLTSPRVNGEFVPRADSSGAFPNLDDDDTAEWGLRIDYVLPSSDLDVVRGGIHRGSRDGVRPSDHFPVWLDIRVPG